MLNISPWEAPATPAPAGTLGVDFPVPGAVDLTGALARLRSRLLPVEQERFGALGARCAEALFHTINRIKPGDSEAEIAAALGYETRRFNVTPIVVLVATDERVHRVRHPLPTGQIMDRYAMLVLCGRQQGLVCSVTRLVHFGPLPDDLRQRMVACAEVDAAMIAASQPGAPLQDVLRVAQETYARVGFDGEWKVHHQGGLAGYTARDVLAVPGETFALEPGMVCAWNPSITGCKSEDSVQVPQPGAVPPILTRMSGWPEMTITVGDQVIARPLILEVR